MKISVKSVIYAKPTQLMHAHGKKYASYLMNAEKDKLMGYLPRDFDLIIMQKSLFFRLFPFLINFVDFAYIVLAYKEKETAMPEYIHFEETYTLP